MGSSVTEIRLVPSRLGSYFRVSRRDCTAAAQLVGGGIGLGSGVFLDATNLDRAAELLSAAERANLEVVLDPMAVELSSPGGWQRARIRELPWARGQLQTPDLFSDRMVRTICKTIADRTVEANVTGVLAPTHYLETMPSDWLGVDERLAVELRHALDDAGGRHVAVYYPLVLNLTQTGPGAAKMYLRDFLSRIANEGAIDGLTLRVHRFGVRFSSPTKIHQYIDLARALHSVGLPIIGERTGTLGVALMAFGAIGAVESGLTVSETCDLSGVLSRRTRKQEGASGRRVYLHELGAFLSVERAEAFLKDGPLRNYHVCHAECCKRASGMIEEPLRHFVHRRAMEVDELSRAPNDIRMDLAIRRLAHYTDLVRKAVEVEPALKRHAKRVTEWERALTEQLVSDKYRKTLTAAAAPSGRRRRPTPRVDDRSSMVGDRPHVIDIQQHLR